jgi:hypothetical protein
MPSDRDQLIVALYEEGVPVAEIAEAAGVCIKTYIQSLVRQGGGCSTRPNRRQSDLYAEQASASGANSWEDGVAALVRSRMAGNVVSERRRI